MDRVQNSYRRRRLAQVGMVGMMAEDTHIIQCATRIEVQVVGLTEGSFRQNKPQIANGSGCLSPFNSQLYTMDFVS